MQSKRDKTIPLPAWKRQKKHSHLQDEGKVENRRSLGCKEIARHFSLQFAVAQKHLMVGARHAIPVHRCTAGACQNRKETIFKETDSDFIFRAARAARQETIRQKCDLKWVSFTWYHRTGRQALREVTRTFPTRGVEAIPRDAYLL